MSLELIRALVENLPNCTDWEVRLVRFEGVGQDQVVGYKSRSIELNPPELLRELLEDIRKEYMDKPNKRLDQYTAVEQYNGNVVGTTIYKLESGNPLIAEAYSHLLTSLNHTDEAINVFEFHANAYVLRGAWMKDDRLVPVKLITVQDPFKFLKHKFLYENDAFIKSDYKVLDLRLYADIMVIGDTLYFMNMAGEKLLGMGRAYRMQSARLVEELSRKDYFSNAENLKRIGASGHFPRVLVGYQPKKLEYLERRTNRKKIAEKFQITLLPDGSIDTGDDISAVRLLRFLCNKGMLDPVDTSPMEVAGARCWS